MKLKFFNHALIAIAAAGSLASCQNEMDCPGPKDGVRPLTFCTKLPVGFTRAFADGNTADVLTCYVYDSTGKTFITEAQGTINGGSGQVTVQLAGNENYKILFWAANSQVFDAKQPQSATMPYQINPNTGELKVDYAQVNGNSDKYDAFYTVLDVTASTNATQEIDLKRAFAQVNVGTNDSELPVVKEAYKNATLATPLIYTEAAIYGVCNRVNLVANTAQSADTTTLKVRREQMNADATGAFSAESFPVAGTPTIKYTSMAYVLASPLGSNVNVGFKAYNTDQADASATQSMMIPNAPIKTNWRTNIYGSLLSSKSNFNVEINPNIQGTEKDVIIANNITQLTNSINAAVTKGETAKVSLGADMADQVLTLPAATTPTVIDLETNGKAIPAIVTAENVTINIYENFPTSNPTSKARRTRAAQALFTANNNSTINIYGGSYESNNMFATAGNGAIHVYGGSFKGVEKATLETYVPEGKYVANGENGFLTITTTKPENVLTVTTKQQFFDAFAEANTTPDTRIVVNADLTFSDGEVVTLTGTGTTLEINPGKVLKYVAESGYFITVNNGADLRIKGAGSFTGKHRFVKVLGTINLEGANINASSDNEITCFYVTEGGIANMIEGSDIKGSGPFFLLSDGSFNMSGGTLNSNDLYCISATQGRNNKINITNGTLTSTRGGIWIVAGTINISGNPKFNLVEPASEYGSYCIYLGNDDNMEYPIYGEISGGEFDGRTYFPICSRNNHVKFSGGKYATSNGNGIFALYGGLTLESILATGYKWETNFGDPVYTHRIVPVTTE